MSTRTETPTARPPVAGVKGARILLVEARFYADIANAPPSRYVGLEAFGLRIVAQRRLS